MTLDGEGSCASEVERGDKVGGMAVAFGGSGVCERLAAGSAVGVCEFPQLAKHKTYTETNNPDKKLEDLANIL